MTNYLHKVLPPQYSHVNKVYCLLAATVFCALPLCSTEAAAENILKYDGTTNIHGDAKTWAAKDEYGGIYAKGGSTVNFTDVDSIYIAAIAGKEGGNDSTVISAKDPFMGDRTGHTNTINISGTVVQLIGSIDVFHSLGSLLNQNARHTVNAALSGSDSFWYGSTIGEDGKRTTVNLSLSDGATWIFNAGKSFLNDGGKIHNLKLDKGVVLFADAEVWETYRNTVIIGIPTKDIPELKLAISRGLAASSKSIWIGSPTTANGNTLRRATLSPSAQRKTVHAKSLNSTWAKLIWTK